MLNNASGNSVQAARTIYFRIYDAATGGNLLWSESRHVTIIDGLFSVLPGAVTPIPYTLFNRDNRYLAVQVADDAEMMPRKRLLSVGYAFTAASISGVKNTFPSSGNVGIGRANPATHLHIYGSTVPARGRFWEKPSRQWKRDKKVSSWFC